MFIDCLFSTHDDQVHRGILSDSDGCLTLICQCHGSGFGMRAITNMFLIEDHDWKVETDPVKALAELGVGVQLEVYKQVLWQTRHLPLFIESRCREDAPGSIAMTGLPGWLNP